MQQLHHEMQSRSAQGRRAFPTLALSVPECQMQLPYYSMISDNLSAEMTAKAHIVVVGAGAFGGWAALHLLRRGLRVTLLDAWGPANSRASSAGETRILRGTYGPNQPYTKMAARAKQLWMEHEKSWGLRLLHRVGVLWMVTSANGQYERDSLPM